MAPRQEIPLLSLVAIRSQQSVTGQTEILWIHKTGTNTVRTWLQNTPYTYKICHIPDYTADSGLINLKIYASGTLIHNKDIFDKSPNRLKGGKLGVFVDSQQMVKWFGISYGCASQSQCSWTMLVLWKFLKLRSSILLLKENIKLWIR